ncbi:MAG: hypothetical protein ACRDN6_04610 [Gaiellaceae bacterium]
MEGVLSGEALLNLPVRVRGIRLAHPVDLVLDAEGRHAVGLEVRCGDETMRFLPLAAARVTAHEIAVRSALLLFEERDQDFYRRGGRTLRALRGVEVRRGGRTLGALVDVTLSPGGVIEEIVLDGPDGRKRVPLDDTVTIVQRGRVTAA